MRILVMGGTKFVGPVVVRALAAQGHRVAVFHRGRTEADLPADVVRLHGDRAELSAHLPAFDRFAPDVVLDMAPMTERHAQTAVHAFGGRVERLVALSSADVYRARNRLFGVEPGPPDPTPLTEDAPLRSVLHPYRSWLPPEDPQYDYDKIPVERIVMGSAGLQGTVLRLPFVYGPGDRQHRLFEYLRRMDAGRPAIPLGAGSAAWRSTRGYVENVAAAVALAVTDSRAAGRIYNVGDAQPFAEADWVRRVGDAAGWSGDVVPVPEAALPDAQRDALDWAHHLVLDTTRVRLELGYREVVTLEEGLDRTVRWERAFPPEPVPPPPDYAAEDAALARTGRPA